MRTVKIVLTGGDGDSMVTNQDDNDHLETQGGGHSHQHTTVGKVFLLSAVLTVRCFRYFSEMSVELNCSHLKGMTKYLCDPPPVPLPPTPVSI